MTSDLSHGQAVQGSLRSLDPKAENYAILFIETLLAAAEQERASDLHLQPAPDGLTIQWRLDGVLHALGNFSPGEAADVVSRLKVMAELLTYKADVPQEGRIRKQTGRTEIRVSTFPTLHGERAVVRFFDSDGRYQFLADLRFSEDIQNKLRETLVETSGTVLISGPAGSGKSTTAYACLREIAQTAEGGKSLVTLEDPIEVAVDGVAQSQVKPAAGFNLASGLRSLMRQDPEVILVGEIRDNETAEAVFQASLTGHLVISTFHAGSAAAAVSRLADMGIEPYQLRSGILAILNQRLVRRLCDCAVPETSADDRLGLAVSQAHVAEGCDHCLGSGYRGRLVLAELLTPDAGSEIGKAILARDDAHQLQELAIQAGMTSLWKRAERAVEEGTTCPAEIRRVLGFGRRG